ncbi:hypothetical protein PAMA_006205 [Pampus argenteus]
MLIQIVKHDCQIPANTGVGTPESLEVEEYQHFFSSQLADRSVGCFMVLSCFSLVVASRRYLGFAVVSLLVEINSVFLHVRQLLLLSGQKNRPGTEITTPRPSVTYRMTSWLNLGTFLVFRVGTLGWMSRWLAGHSDLLPRYVLLMGAAGLSLISTMNIVLLYRLLRADILNNTHNTDKDH